jgi:type I restriction enzyme S subunit
MSPLQQRALAAYATGTTVAGISQKALRSVLITVPPSSEQVVIGRVLGSLDAKIELNRRMNETLEAMARTLFKSWFVDFDPIRAKAESRDPGLPKPIADLFPARLIASELGETPEGWPVVTLPHVIDVNPTRPLPKGQVAPYLDMANMPTQGHTPDTVIDRPFGSGMRFVNGNTLIARITPCLEDRKTAFVDFLERWQIGWGSTEYIVLGPKPPLPEELAYCLARSDRFREFAIQSMTGTSGRQRVPAEALSHYRIAAPPKEIGEHFGEVVAPLFARAAAAARESHVFASLRDALLPKLISGELRVKDHSWTVAEAAG